jgi:hypothetical protein
MGFEVKVDTVTVNWARAARSMDRIRREISITMARHVVKTIKRGIIQREFAVRPKSESWARRSLDERPLINTREYVNGLRAVKTPDGAAIEGNTVLAKWLEFGTKKMRPMPHFRPAIRQLNEKLGDVVDGKKGFLNVLFGR